MVVATAEAVRPPERITVSEAAETYHIVNNPGQHVGPFSLEKTPYLREPMDVLTSLDYTGMVFVAPARTGKSAMALNWLCHTAITDPADMMVVHMAQHTARDWSQADLAKAIRNSPELRRRLTPGRQNDNTFDKHFLSGMRLLVSWPTITNLSGKTIPRGWFMDYDRMPQDIDGEGNPFDLGRKRGGTFKRYAMWAAEASPGFPVNDAKWTPRTPHEAPPTGDEKGGGILQLYNRGDRRRFYWACPQCESSFEPHFRLLDWPKLDSGDLMEMAEQVTMHCPHCGGIMEPGEQRALNNAARWVKDGQIWHPSSDTITGDARRSDIASFWMFGPAAGFTDWSLLVHRYLVAHEQFENTGDEGPLMVTVNTDQGDAYTMKATEGGRLPEELKSRAEDWGSAEVEPCIPAQAMGGFLVSTVDVQKESFVVHVFLLSHGDIWHIDMFKIRKSQRLDADGDRQRLDPAAYPEDWDLLVPEVLEKDYPINDGSGRRMQVKIVGCDSGGKDGVTANAYDFWRRLSAKGNAARFHLLKGAPSRTETAPLRRTLPDSQQKDRLAIARGDVPVWLVNSNIVKDQASNMLARTEGRGMVRFPDWAPDWLYTQLTTEVRTPKGWENPSRRRNEAFDLLAYCIALQRHPDVRTHLPGFWDAPPGWAAEWDRNDLVYLEGEDGGRRFAGNEGVDDEFDLEDLAGKLG
ncbi:phage terminase large subunit family protein [Novosphingobium sp. YJ-S2-02]|uniref:Phage terminase large subunit family protein n=1 Tax=Novosphingobium aureum TaxID=2792964 RepID=A0A931MLP2_9SPHN|nr:terminase gpA endonuclease subunit [Novosphingobium aureum]MBH0113276.1 phage terminase large subunit family protein [Novosphingobium aureum]